MNRQQPETEPARTWNHPPRREPLVAVDESRRRTREEIARAWVERNTPVRSPAVPPAADPQYSVAVGVLEFAAAFERAGAGATPSVLERQTARGDQAAAEVDLLRSTLTALAIAAQAVVTKYGVNDGAVHELEEAAGRARIALARTGLTGMGAV